jgi:hypothetical protein
MQSDPSKAYLANSPYIYAYFRQQHPISMRWVQLLAGISSPMASEQACHCELGFGQGLGLAITAATSIEQQVGVDFMPEQVKELTQLLARSGVEARLHSADFAQFLTTNKQTFQSISLHGVWSWVAPEIRQQILTIIKRFLSDDGMVYLSHNTLPACAPILPLQRLIHHTASVFKDQDDLGLRAALAVLQSAMPVSRYFADEPSLLNWWHSLEHENPRYLAHEYLGHAWNPMSFSDTADCLAQVGLSFACSADASELIPDWHFSESQQDWLDALPEGNLRESYADLLRNQTFRRDIWQKNPVTLTLAEQTQAILSTQLVLLHPLTVIDEMIQDDYARFKLAQSVTHQLLNQLADNSYMPKSIEAMLTAINDGIANDETISAIDLIPLLAWLTSLGGVHPANTEISDELIQSAQRLNTHLMDTAWQDGRIAYLASPVAACGVQVSRLQQLALLAYLATQKVNARCWVDWILQQAHQQASDSVFPPDINTPQQHAWLVSHYEKFIEQRFPLLLALKVVSVLVPAADEA